MQFSLTLGFRRRHLRSNPGYTKQSLKQLYAHLGEARITKILDDFYKRMAADLMIGFFFTGLNVTEIAKMQMAFLLRSMGVTPTYSGRPPAQAHKELPPILRGHFDRRLKILEETLRAHDVHVEDMRIWLAFEASFRKVVTKSAHR